MLGLLGAEPPVAVGVGLDLLDRPEGATTHILDSRTIDHSEPDYNSPLIHQHIDLQGRDSSPSPTNSATGHCDL
jgi:hypothetical protein